MNTLLKSQILDKKSYASNQIGPLAYLVHKLSGQGDYTVRVSDRTNQRLQFYVRCSPNHDQNSQNIDVSDPGLDQKTFLLNSDHGYLLFYHSGEFVSWKIEITNVTAGNKPEFDSDKPSTGDLMALNIIKPGKYALKSQLKQSEIEVLHPEEAAMQHRMNIPVNRFSHADFSLRQRKIFNPNQGMVFEFSKEMPSFSIDLVQEKTAKTPFDVKIREEVKTKLAARLRTNAPLQKKYKWNGSRGPII